MALTVSKEYAQARPTPLLRTAHVARWLGVSRRTVFRLRDAGDLVPIYIDSRPSYDPDEVRALIERRRRGDPTS